ncbi:MAG: MBL fold metallo-hydrolase [Clostridia bacterium]|nr:MBL fold metallo-hydrolase [Clostridia bacterium]
MKIKYLGHSCFSIINRNEKVLICDPFDSTIGYTMATVEADIVTISHSHHDHSNLKKVKGSYDLIKTSKIYSGNGFNISSMGTFHDAFKGSKRGNNLSYIITCDGVSVCHLGDLGHMLSPKQLNMVKDVSAFFLPVGGTFTLDKKNLQKLVKKLQDKIIIPMHYKTEDCKLPISDLDDYLKSTFLHTFRMSELDISSDNLSSFSPGNYILDIISAWDKK